MLDQGALGMIHGEYGDTLENGYSSHGQTRRDDRHGHRSHGDAGREDRHKHRSHGDHVRENGHGSRSHGDGGSRSSSVREINDHLEDWDPMEIMKSRRNPGGKKFLKKVQHELEEQRQEWKDEVDKLTNGPVLHDLPKNAHAQGTNSFVDTSTGVAIFTALVDVSEFRNRSVEVDYDDFNNKLIVHGQSRNGLGTMTKTFTQKVQLPRYADDKRISTKLSDSGILKVEVPLLYYFPEHQKKGRDVKSFVNEVRTGRDGSQTLEILVNTGPGVRAKDLHVQVTEERILLITAQMTDERGESVRKLIKKYTLPDVADVDNIRSRMGKDGRLMVLIPLRKH